MREENRPSGALRGLAQDVRGTVRESFIAGVALVLPLLITVIILGIALDFVVQLLRPISVVVRMVEVGRAPHWMTEATIIAAFGLVVFVLGFVIENTPSERVTDRFHALMGAIPGVGSVYLIFHRMSEALSQGNTKSFREVKLVEYPSDGTYSFGFVTGTPPNQLSEAMTDRNLQTLFMPLAPNPVLGGRVIYVPEENTYDIDMTVEEAIRTLVTSGVVTHTRENASEGPPGESHPD